jgi:hypothetical protein
MRGMISEASASVFVQTLKCLLSAGSLWSTILGRWGVRYVGPCALADRNHRTLLSPFRGLRMVTIMPQGFPSVNIELRAPVRLELDEEDAAELIATIQADRFQ